ncbi:hypothetical protein [Flavobacterium filum]|uniref:hypothetical protein n=1 Tax=Flavobacterium filum TaxID=370974 RepID=UPI0023F16542|nr:hypothetical protein [Flavobacterium filum]
MKEIANETAFENHIRKDILNEIISENQSYKLFNFKKAVDVLIAKNGANPKLFFIEIKYHIESSGRLGIGQAQGRGFQPELLKDKTDYFENNLRWILGKENSEEYWFVDNNKIREYLNAGVIDKKHNGITAKFFKEVNSMNKVELIDKIKEWLFKI